MGNSVNLGRSVKEIKAIFECGRGIYFDNPDHVDYFDHTQATLVAAAIWGIMLTEDQSDCNGLVEPIVTAVDAILSENKKFFSDPDVNIREQYSPKDIYKHVDILLDMVDHQKWSIEHNRKGFRTIGNLHNWRKAYKKIMKSTEELLRKYKWCTNDQQKEPYLEKCGKWEEMIRRCCNSERDKSFKDKRFLLEQWRRRIEENYASSSMESFCNTTPQLKF